MTYRRTDGGKSLYSFISYLHYLVGFRFWFREGEYVSRSVFRLASCCCCCCRIVSHCGDDITVVAFFLTRRKTNRTADVELHLSSNLFIPEEFVPDVDCENCGDRRNLFLFSGKGDRCKHGGRSNEAWIAIATTYSRRAIKYALTVIVGFMVVFGQDQTSVGFLMTEASGLVPYWIDDLYWNFVSLIYASIRKIEWK